MKKIALDPKKIVEDTVRKVLGGKVSSSTLDVLVEHLAYAHEFSFDNLTTFSEVTAFTKTLEKDCEKYIHKNPVETLYRDSVSRVKPWEFPGRNG